MSNETPPPSGGVIGGKSGKLFDAFWDYDNNRPKLGPDGQPAAQKVDSLYLLITGGEEWEENRRKRHQLVGAHVSFVNRRIAKAGLRIKPSDTLKHAYVIDRLI